MNEEAREARKRYLKEWRKKNPERVQQYERKRRKNMSEEARREYQRRWREKNREHILQYKREWRKNNPEKVKAAQARFYERQAAKFLEEEK